MAQNDMEVIMYKILKYLYESLKVGHKTALKEIAWQCELFDITHDYWLVIMRELIDSGYITGLKYICAKDMEGIQELHAPAITKAGREYLQENSLMQKVKNILGESFKITLGGVIGKL